VARKIANSKPRVFDMMVEAADPSLGFAAHDPLGHSAWSTGDWGLGAFFLQRTGPVFLGLWDPERRLCLSEEVKKARRQRLAGRRLVIITKTITDDPGDLLLISERPRGSL
jgi:hypothetical protein